MIKRIYLMALFCASAFLFCTANEPQAHEYDWAAIDEESFESFQPTDKIMDTIGITEGMNVGEVGAGGGRVAVRVARRVGPSGKVYANDITELALEYMRQRCRKDEITNMEVVEGTLTDPRFPEGILDAVYLTNTYRHLDKPLEVLRNIAPSLKPSGKLGIIDSKRYRQDAEGEAEGGSNPIILHTDQAGFRLVKLETSMSRDDIYVFELKSRKEESYGPYLGQKPPGMTPELFAPGPVTTDMGEGCSGWGNEMEYFIFQRWKDRVPSLYLMHQTNGVWSAPEHVTSLDKYRAGDFTVAPDGKTMVFASNIFIEEIGAEGEGGNIWTVEKTETGWTEAQHIGLRINTKYHESYPCLTANGNLYFFSRRPGGYGTSDLYVSELSGGEYQAPVNLGSTLNTKYHEWDTYTAPDESYMIYCSTMPDGLGDDDLYVTFKTREGSWSEPVHMGNEINTDKSENRPYVSPDGKYLFYTSTIRGNRDIYWVDAKIIDGLKPNGSRIKPQ